MLLITTNIALLPYSLLVSSESGFVSERVLRPRNAKMLETKGTCVHILKLCQVL